MIIRHVKKVIAFFLLYFALNTTLHASITQPIPAIQADKNRADILFSWKEPLVYRATLHKKRLIIWFEKPFQNDVNQFANKLSQFVRQITVSEDRHILTFYLYNKCKLESEYHSPKDIRITLTQDVVPVEQQSDIQKMSSILEKRKQTTSVDAQQNLTKDKVEKVSTKAEKSQKSLKEPEKLKTVTKTTNTKKLPPVKFRVGSHKKYDRLVFEWPQKTKYNLAFNSGDFIVEFEGSGTINTQKIKSRLPKYIHLKNISQKNSNHVKFHFQIDTDVKIRDFQIDKRSVFDFIKTKNTQQKKKPKTTLTPPKTQKQRTSKTEPPEEKNQNQQKVVPQEQKSNRTEQSSKEIVTEKVADLAPSSSVAITEFPNIKKSGQEIKKVLIDVKEQKRDNKISLTLTFEWDQETALAAFRRAENIWVVFDQPSHLVLDQLKKIKSSFIQAVVQMPHAEMAALKLTVDPRFNPSISKKKHHWLITFSEQNIKTQNALKITPIHDLIKGSKLKISSKSHTKTLHLKDPSVGDELIIIPVRNDNYGIKKPYDLVKFSLLNTLQGIVVEPKSDDLKVSLGVKDVVISSDTSLYISKMQQAPEKNDHGKDQQQTSQKKRLFDLYSWSKKNKGDFLYNQRSFQKAIARFASFGEPLDELADIRFELAKFYFAYKMPSNTIGLLRLIEKDTPSFTKNTSFIALKGASYYFLDDFENATKYLSSPKLDSYPEMRYWRGAIETIHENPFGANKLFDDFKKFPQWYPKDLKGHFILLALESAIQAGAISKAETIIKKLPKRASPQQKKQAKYLHGALLWLKGQKKAAQKIWISLEKDTDPKVRAKATLARVESEYIQKKISSLEAAQQLEDLRYLQRGSNFEYRLLHKLGKFYLDGGRIIKGLQTLRNAVSFFPNHPNINEIKKLMSENFQKFFIETDTHKISPIKAIALFSEFRELTPPGKKGDVIINNLINQLVAIDLVEHAVDLLKFQVEYRLRGDERVNAVLRLATLLIDNGESKKAAEILEKTSPDNTTKEKAEELKNMTAMAFADSGKKDEALKILKNEKSRASLLLKAEIYWSMEDWGNVSKTIKEIFDRKRTKSLVDQDLKMVVNWAMAASLAGDQNKIDFIKSRYGEKINNSIYSEIFRIATSGNPIPEELDGDMRSYAKQVASTSLYGSFMDEYRQRWENK